MLSHEHEQHFWQLIASRVRDFDNALPRAYGHVTAEMAQQGTLNSGMTVKALVDISCQDIRQRASAGWNVMQRVLSDFGVTPDYPTEQSLILLLGRFIEQQRERVAHLLLAALPHGLRVTGSHLEVEALAQREHIEAEIKFLLEKLRRQQTPAPNQPVYNFHGAVGAVQTGPGSTATVTQNLQGAALDEFVAAFVQLRAGIESASDLESERKTELVAVVDEVLAESRHARPNSTRLLGLAHGAAIAIQTTASLGPALQAFRAALLSVGIVLP